MQQVWALVKSNIQLRLYFSVMCVRQFSRDRDRGQGQGSIDKAEARRGEAAENQAQTRPMQGSKKIMY